MENTRLQQITANLVEEQVEGGVEDTVHTVPPEPPPRLQDLLRPWMMNLQILASGGAAVCSCLFVLSSVQPFFLSWFRAVAPLNPTCLCCFLTSCLLMKPSLGSGPLCPFESNKREMLKVELQLLFSPHASALPFLFTPQKISTSARNQE